MARSDLNWSIRKLAAEAKLAPNTVLSFEAGRPVLPSTVEALKSVLNSQKYLFLTEIEGQPGVGVFRMSAP